MPNDKFSVYMGSTLPSVISPLVIVAAGTPGPNTTVVEKYVMFPGSDPWEQRVMSLGMLYKLDLHALAPVITFEQIFETEVESLGWAIEEKLLTSRPAEAPFKMAPPFNLTEVRNSWLVHYRLHQGFSPYLRKIRDNTKCDALREYLVLVCGISLESTTSLDPFAEN
jgi:hypothetical protein